MKLWIKAAVVSLSFSTVAHAAEAGSLKVSVDLTNQRMHVKENGETIHSWAISSGRRGYRTVTGKFKPKWMTRMHYSRKYDNAPMPNAIFFHRGYAIHGTYATGRLGRPASHGCIRLSPRNAKILYNLVSRHGRGNTTIAVHGSARDRSYVTSKSRKSNKRYAKRRTRNVSRYSMPSDPPRPKVIYRNGKAYVYVGKKAARQYYSKKRYSGSYYNY
jgi:L,D-transpeptidase catalytic domain